MQLNLQHPTNITSRFYSLQVDIPPNFKNEILLIIVVTPLQVYNISDNIEKVVIHNYSLIEYLLEKGNNPGGGMILDA